MTTATLPARRIFDWRFMATSFAFTVLGTLVLLAAASLISGGARINYGRTPWALIIHVGTVIPALILGAPVLLMKKGTARHKMMGRIWASLMMVTAISSFWLQGLTGSIGPIHIFSVITIVSIPRAILAARRGDLVAHRRGMIGPYIGLFVAGLFSFLPDRMMGQIAFSLF